MINVHSWGPFLTTDINRAEFGIFSRDVLSTTQIDLGYTYDVNEETGFASAGLSYQGWYPIIDIKAEYGDRSSDDQFFNAEDSLINVDFNWKETTIQAGLRIPFQLTRSKFFTSLSVSNDVRITKVTSFENSINGGGRIIPVTDSTAVIFRDQLDNGTLINNVFSVVGSRLLKTSQRDILPQWGQFVAFEHWSSPFGGDFSSGLFAFRSAAFFPSPFQLIGPEIFKHHSLNLRYSYQSMQFGLEEDSYLLRNRIGRPRGYSFPTDNKFHYLAINYTLPLIYPDVALGPVLNIQRIKANLFYDYGFGELDLPEADFLRQQTYQSFGAEITFDFNLFRFRPLFEVGARYTYRQATQFEPAGTEIELIIGNIGI
ncbi:MAG: hypothetical protein R3345_08485, partial [Fulvivirga sp.]|nr:hypothetical protein [Fulvivirga sp.]